MLGREGGEGVEGGAAMLVGTAKVGAEVECAGLGERGGGR